MNDYCTRCGRMNWLNEQLLCGSCNYQIIETGANWDEILKGETLE